MKATVHRRPSEVNDGARQGYNDTAVAVLGIVLATYNEAGNLPRLIEELEGLALPVDVDVLVVDDNSPDGTSDVARGLAERYGNISVMTRPGKLGLGSALRQGMEAALSRGSTWVLTMDADLSHDPNDVPRLLDAAREGADFVQGSRYMPGGGTRSWSWWRRLKSTVANRSLRWLLGAPMDSTSNFRVYAEHTARLVVAEARTRDYEFQPEAALIVLRDGLRIIEVPIIFTGRVEGKSKLGMAQNIRWIVFLVRSLLVFRLRPRRSSASAPER